MQNLGPPLNVDGTSRFAPINRVSWLICSRTS